MTIPVSIITGFLGSGKTTTVNALLGDPAFAETAVLINEFGDVQIDHDLITEFSADLITTTTGCLCCTASSDIKQALFDLWRRRKDREIGPFRRVIVETTGLLDPAPVINSLLTPHAPGLVDAIVKNQFSLSQVLAMFDAVVGAENLDRFVEARRQIGFADAVVLTKTDLPSQPVDDLRRRIASINPGAQIFDRRSGWPALRERLREGRSYDLRAKGADAIGWIDAESVHAAQHDHTHDHPINPSRHGDDIRSHVITTEAPLNQAGLRRFIAELKKSASARLLRLKGLVAMREHPDRPFVIHGVQHLIHPIHQLDGWPSDDRRTRIVMIGQGLDAEVIGQMLREEARNG